MCGIGGIFFKVGDAADHEITLHRLQEALHHRGPDGHGRFVSASVALIHTRLSIIDLETGGQPLVDGQGRVLIANGEIYNYRELRDSNYTTGSDCETLLRLWPRHGEDILGKVRGMFAFALYDGPNEELILGRDPFGIKPLYYVDTPDYIAFASEPRTLFGAALCSRDTDRAAQEELMSLRYTTGRQTPFREIQRVLPGEILRIKKGEIIKRSQHKPIDWPAPPQVSLDDLDQVLSESVSLHLRSDVDYGLFLSGGIDSSILLSLMHRHHGPGFKTYSIGFSGTQQYDERYQARKMAHSLGTDHVELDFTEQDFWHLLPGVVHALDDPVIDYAALPTYKLAQAAAKDVKVILCGEGGDESFAGYRRYQKALRPKCMGGRLWRAKGFLSGTDLWREPPRGWKGHIEETLAELEALPLSDLQKSQAIDFFHWLPNDLLTKLDRCLMAHGVEGRTPFVDQKVSSFGLYAKDRFKIRSPFPWSQGKWALREWLSKHLPAAEPFAKKRGFKVPVGEWLLKKNHILAELIPQQQGIQELFDPEKVCSFFQNLTPEGSLQAWGLLFYSLWHQHHVLGVPLGETALDMLETKF